MEDIQRQLDENKVKLDKMEDAHKRMFQPASEPTDTDWDEYERVHVRGD